ncbi:hypothetical protein [Prevotella sp.]|uniref:hypothetical protein n=1 Tax=Prevotella sp. TaxID=59823 RepID=UPI002F934C06
MKKAKANFEKNVMGDGAALFGGVNGSEFILQKAVAAWFISKLKTFGPKNANFELFCK